MLIIDSSDQRPHESGYKSGYPGRIVWRKFDGSQNAVLYVSSGGNLYFAANNKIYKLNITQA